MPYIDTKKYDIYFDIRDMRIKSSLFEVDELIAPIISLLNKKGYKTEYCCSGHYDESKYSKGHTILNDNCYITFSNINIFKNLECDMPPNFEIEYNDTNSNRFIIRKHYQSKNIERYYEIIETMKSLLEWVSKLPKINNIKEIS